MPSAIWAELQRLSALVQLALSRPTDYSTQAVWHIDFDNGNDRNDGLTQATALLTLGELFKRVGRDFAPKQSVDIYLYGDNKPTDPWDAEWSFNVPTSLPVVYIPPALPQYPLIQARVHAMTPTTYYTGAFTAVRREVRSYPGDLPLVVTDTNMKGVNQTPPVAPPNDQVFWYNSTLTWFNLPRGGNHDQQRMRITGGPRAGAVAWTAPGNLQGFGVFGGGQNGAIRCNIFGISVPFGYTLQFQTVGVTAVAVDVGDPYVVERLQLLYINRIVSKGNGDYGGSGIAFNGFTLRVTDGGDSQNPSTQPIIRCDGGSIVFVECGIDFSFSVQGSGFGSIFYALNCSTIDGIGAVGPGLFYVDSGVHHLQLSAANGAFMIIDADALVQTGHILALRTGEIWLNTAQVWDIPGHAIKAALLATDGGRIRPFVTGFYGPGRVWGRDETLQRKYGIAAHDGGVIEFDPAYTAAMITVSGITKDIAIGHSGEHNNLGVGIDPATLQITTMRDLTYDNFFNKTIAQGGFGQGTGQPAHIADPETLAVIHGPTPQT